MSHALLATNHAGRNNSPFCIVTHRLRHRMWCKRYELYALFPGSEIDCDAHTTCTLHGREIAEPH